MCPNDSSTPYGGGIIVKFQGVSPKIADSSFIANSAIIIGNVTIHDQASIWFNSVLRGDIDHIVIGENTNIQDGTVIHCHKGSPTIIGKNVSVGHNSTIHGCTIEDNCLIGMGTIIMSGAYIGKNTMIAAGSLIPQGRIIPENSLVMGNPGQVMRKITKTEMQLMKDNVMDYIQLTKEFKRKNNL